MKSSALPYWLTAIVVLVAAYGFAKTWRSSNDGPAIVFQGGELSPTDRVAPNEPPLTEFMLTDSQGKEFNSKQLDGEVWVASYFFTNCPSACVRLNQGLSTIHQDPQFADVKLVSITCDPDADTVERLAEYAKNFHADPERWFFCRGEFDYVQRIAEDKMKIGLKKQEHANYGLVIDRAGKVRGRFIVTNEREMGMLQNTLAECLAEAPPVAKNTSEAESTEPTEEPAAESPAAEAPSADEKVPAPPEPPLEEAAAQ